MGHYPVLLNEMLEVLSPKDGGVYLDATFGGGGYSQAILNKADCYVVGLDRDPDAIARGQEIEKKYSTRFRILQGTFSDLPNLMQEAKIKDLDGVVFDFGVSSFQLDEADRGFSFRFDGPLDMRMSAEGKTASDIVNTFDEQELADIIFQYGEERQAKRIAKGIVNYRKEKKIKTTLELSNLIKSIIKTSKDDIHPATLTFQALRIFVNNELIEIDNGLSFSKNFLKIGGKLVAVTFHSLEDRLVKMFIRQHSGRSQVVSRYLPEGTEKSIQLFRDLFPKGLTPQKEEVLANPRSRSARLRAAMRLADGVSNA